MEKVALYARVSTDKQDIQPQIEELKDWAEYRGVDYQVFEDDGIAATEDKRPGFDYMMDRIEEFDAVAMRHLDRFGRTVYELSNWANKLEEKGIDLVFTKQNLDTSTEHGKLLFHILAAIAEYERNLREERMKAGYEKAVERGKVGRPKKDLPIDEIVESYTEHGASVSYLADKYDVTRKTIYDRLEKAGVKNGEKQKKLIK